MAETSMGGNPVHTAGDLPATGQPAPAFTVVKGDLSTVSLSDFAGQRVVLNIFPSIDTPTCAASVRRFNEAAGNLDNTTILNVSMDLPFAVKDFCAAEGIEGVRVGSAFRSTFGDDYGVRLTDSKFEGLLARSVVVVDTDGSVLHSQLVPSISEEPDYDAAVAALG